MNKVFHVTFILILILLAGCAKKNKPPKPDKTIMKEIAKEILEIDSTNIESPNDPAQSNIVIEQEKLDTNIIMEQERPDVMDRKNDVNIPLNENSDRFYELEQSMEEILLKISFLETQLLTDESTIPTTSYTDKLKKLIDGPRKKHQISLKNESIIEGFIEKNTEINVMIMTSVGRLTIEKNEIVSIDEITALETDIIFIGHGLEQKFDDHYLFTGKILNQGTLRGDFVRVIFKLWANDTNILYSDSSFVEGNKIKYDSGIVTDTALNPNKSARYTVKVPIEKNVLPSYITREINWTNYN